MTQRIFILTLLFLPILSSCRQKSDINHVDSFVSNLFKSGHFVSYDSTNFKGYNKDFQVLKTPTLNLVLPEYCFYSTIFYSNYFEYMDVKTAIAFAKISSKKSIILHSPTFTSESKDFLKIFYGIKTIDTLQSVKVAAEISSILSNITYAGRFARLKNLTHKNIISFELWHGDLSWRIYDFYFDENRMLTEITIKSGVKRQSIDPTYLRL